MKEYSKRQWCILREGELVRRSNDLPYVCSKEVAFENVRYLTSLGVKAYMLKVGKDVILGHY